MAKEAANIQQRDEKVLAAEVANEQCRHELAAQSMESDGAIDHIQTEFALCTATLDAILSEIACNKATYTTILAAIACDEAANMTMLSPCRPTLYVDAVLFIGGSTQLA